MRKNRTPRSSHGILKIISKLYRIEDTLREAGAAPAARVVMRERHSARLVKLFRRAVDYLLTRRILPKSDPGLALRYALGQLPAMETYLHDGRVEIDNNLIENAIRPSAVGKKNWLFVGSAEAGERAAVIYSLLVSARAHGVNPEAYLRDLIGKLPGRKSNDIDDLLPGAWAAAHRAGHPRQRAEQIPPRRLIRNRGSLGDLLRIGDGQELTWSAAQGWSEEMMALLLLLDLWIQNEDRSLSELGGNPNLLVTQIPPLPADDPEGALWLDQPRREML